MTRRTTLLIIGMLEEKQCAAAVPRRDLEIRRADPNAVVFAFSVLTMGDE
jgi:hypothetical protein